MYGPELIETFFSPHPNKEFDLKFRCEGGFFCGWKSPIYKFERLKDGNIIIYYREVTELRNVPVVEDGEIIGHCRLGQPHTTFVSLGAFMCLAVKSIIEKEPTVKGWIKKDVKITKRFWNNYLSIHISNDNIDLKVECLSIVPYNLSDEEHQFK